jgi:hypothetical protein
MAAEKLEVTIAGGDEDGSLGVWCGERRSCHDRWVESHAPAFERDKRWDTSGD